MKTSIKYLRLWQKKRSELPVNDDKQTDWFEMRTILDQHMHVAGTDNEKPSRLKGFKLWSVLFVSLSAAALMYLVANVYELKKHKHNSYGYHQQHKMDSVYNSLSATHIADSLNSGSKKINNENTLHGIKPHAAIGETRQSNPVLSEKSNNGSLPQAAWNKNSSASAKQTNLLAENIRNKSRRFGTNNSGKLIPTSAVNNKSKFDRYRSAYHNEAPSVIGNHSWNGSRHLGRISNHTLVKTQNKQSFESKIDRNERKQSLLLITPVPVFNTDINNLSASLTSGLNFNLVQKSGYNQSTGNSKTKNAKTKNARNPSSIEWGLLTGVNSSGSFTTKSQNSNFYGSLPADLYFGLYATYNLSDRWAINSQIHLFSPQTISGSYSEPNQSKVDSGQMLKITDSWKNYFVTVPLHIMYRATSNVSIKAGPVFNFPVKQANAASLLQPAGVKTDTAYYPKIKNMLNETKYEQKFNLGLSGGLNFQFNRMSFEATYLKNLSGNHTISGFGSHTYNSDTFQFTVGFKLNKAKP